MIRNTIFFIIYLYITLYHKTIRLDPKFITVGEVAHGGRGGMRTGLAGGGGMCHSGDGIAVGSGGGGGVPIGGVYIFKSILSMYLKEFPNFF